MAAVILIIIMFGLLGFIAARPIAKELGKFKDEYTGTEKKERKELWLLMCIFAMVIIGSMIGTIIVQSAGDVWTQEHTTAVLICGAVICTVLVIIAICIIAATGKKSEKEPKEKLKNGK